MAYSTANGTATAGSDYAATNGTLTFAAGETSKTVHVDISGDTVFEGNETFTVSLGATPGLRLGTASATSTIVNDDATPTFSIGLAEALPAAGLLEGDVGNVNHAFTVSLLGGARQFNTSVNWAVTGTGGTPASATDFANGVLPTGILTFAPGESTKTILVPVRGDLVDGAPFWLTQQQRPRSSMTTRSSRSPDLSRRSRKASPGPVSTSSRST